MIKKKQKKLFYYVIHRSSKRTLTLSMHSTFESASMAGRFFLSLRKADPEWLKDFKHLNVKSTSSISLKMCVKHV